MSPCEKNEPVHTLHVRFIIRITHIRIVIGGVQTKQCTIPIASASHTLNSTRHSFHSRHSLEIYKIIPHPPHPKKFAPPCPAWPKPPFTPPSPLPPSLFPYETSLFVRPRIAAPIRSINQVSNPPSMRKNTIALILHSFMYAISQLNTHRILFRVLKLKEAKIDR